MIAKINNKAPLKADAFQHGLTLQNDFFLLKTGRG
jgi:hypothetical protein